MTKLHTRIDLLKRKVVFCDISKKDGEIKLCRSHTGALLYRVPLSEQWGDVPLSGSLTGSASDLNQCPVAGRRVLTVDQTLT